MCALLRAGWLLGSTPKPSITCLAPSILLVPPPLLSCRPLCKIFIADSQCCSGYGIIQHAAVRMWLVCNADVYLPEPTCLTGAWAVGCGCCGVCHLAIPAARDAAGGPYGWSERTSQTTCPSVLVLCTHNLAPAAPSGWLPSAVVDTSTNEIIPPLDPNNPDPLNSVNTSVVETPNARAEGAAARTLLAGLPPFWRCQLAEQPVACCCPGFRAISFSRAQHRNGPACLPACRAAGGAAPGILCSAGQPRAWPACRAAGFRADEVRGRWWHGGSWGVALAPAPACRWHRRGSVAMCCSSPQPSRSALPPAAPPLHLLCRMNEDGQCSLRLRVPCEWEGAVYEAVTAVQPMPLLSGDWGGWWPMPPRGC